MHHRLFALALALCAALPAQAQQARALYDLLRLDDMVAIMRDEGIAYGRELGDDMLGPRAGAGWDTLLAEIYDTDRMGALVEARFTAAIDDDAVGPLIDYFRTDQGQEVVSLELAARGAMIDDAVEEVALELVEVRLDRVVLVLARLVVVGDNDVRVRGVHPIAVDFALAVRDGERGELTVLSRSERPNVDLRPAEHLPRAREPSPDGLEAVFLEIVGKGVAEITS
jgi:hypothetical protein